jgi:hypothetical protein
VDQDHPKTTKHLTKEAKVGDFRSAPDQVAALEPPNAALRGGYGDDSWGQSLKGRVEMGSC